MTQRQEPLTPHRAIVELVKKLRERRGWSARRLGEEMSAVGVAWDRSLVANLENGRRAYVTADELLALAYVLGLHPVDLLVPGDLAGEEPYSVASAVTTTADTARAWIAGIGFLEEPESPAELAEAIQSMPKTRAQEVARAWFTREREAELNRAALAADGPAERSLADVIAETASVAADPDAVVREMVGTLREVAGEDGLRELQAALDEAKRKESDANDQES